MGLWAPAALAQKSAHRKAAPAAVSRPRSGERARPARVAPADLRPGRYLGEGFFSRVHRSRDGRHVLKVMKRTYAYRKRISEERRVRLAERTVAASEALRKRGFPIPASSRHREAPGVIVQEYVGGFQLGQLRGAARTRAQSAAAQLIGAAKEAAREMGARSWYVDGNLKNLRFDKNGAIKAWIDPIIPISPDESSRVWGAKQRLPAHIMALPSPRRGPVGRFFRKIDKMIFGF